MTLGYIRDDRIRCLSRDGLLLIIHPEMPPYVWDGSEMREVSSNGGFLFLQDVTVEFDG